MIQLRPYQLDMKTQVAEAFKPYKKVMLQLPTGGGKTIILTDVTNDWVKKGATVWILVHRKELVDQTLNKLRKYNLYTSVIQSGYQFSYFSPVQVVSVQTATRRLDRQFKEPQLIICDEAHHSTANSYTSIFKRFPNARLLGVTATPIRSNGEGFKHIFDTLVTGPTVKQLIDAGYLVKPKIYANPLHFDLKSVKITAGDYNERALYEAISESSTYGDYVKSWQDKAAGKRTVTFAINVEHSQNIVEMYKRAGIPAEHVDGTTEKSARNAILRRLATGETLVVSNVGIVTEGFDLPAIECVQLARPTKSLALYLQMVGRGLRPASDKGQALVLDHSDCVFNHGFPEQDRIWTLDGVKKPKRPKKVMAYDRKTDRTYERHELPDHIRDVELIEVDFDEVRMAEMDKLCTIAKRNHYKPGWVWHKFIEKFNRPTVYEIQRMQKLAGYNPKWIDYQLRDYGYTTTNI